MSIQKPARLGKKTPIGIDVACHAIALFGAAALAVTGIGVGMAVGGTLAIGAGVIAGVAGLALGVEFGPNYVYEKLFHGKTIGGPAPA